MEVIGCALPACPDGAWTAILAWHSMITIRNAMLTCNGRSAQAAKPASALLVGRGRRGVV
jgi:hypothetical protein